MKKIALIEINSELGAGTRGSSLGVDALRVASWKKESTFFSNYPSKRLPNNNQLLEQKPNSESAKYIEGIFDLHEMIRKELSETIIAGKEFPVVIAGDHSSSAATISGVKLAKPNERLGVIWVDAHGDLHSPYTTPSGNMHGMPLAMVLSRDNLPSKLRELDPEVSNYWSRLKNSGELSPKIAPHDLVFFALRDTEAAEEKIMEKEGMKNFSVAQIRREGVKVCVEKALNYLKDCDTIYLSFDVDSLDCDRVSDGTGTPVKNGLDPEEAQEILIGIIESGKVICFDMVEINPTLDTKGNVMAETSFDILESVVHSIEEQLKKHEQQ